ncbi:uncharacterized protein Dwil_GK11101 [Drosophila willistoni]|uniref:Uncharacterized protein n=1 Tax=Drosophila willistoni TaxID=7260 RepID=B4N850_DROWI|nr:uncharacterized protein LOC6647409 [Drosophila willistoni]EDW81301.2 uncharacterized protein Dwil_GK11101 [Drosophila willistoni]
MDRTFAGLALWLWFLLSSATASSSYSSNSHLKRFSRSLIFPPTTPTRVQFIGGIGIPVDGLHFESVTSGYVLKAEYFLPTNSTEITRVYLKPMTVSAREKEINGNEQFDYGAIYRWIIYRGIEMILDNMGLPGRSCLLRVICEHAAVPLSHESGLLGEILHIILTPSSSNDKLTHRMDGEYQESEHYGKRGGDCNAAYAKKCSKSPMDLISIIMKVNK